MHTPTQIASELLHLSGQQGKTLTPMQLLKITYISHGWMLGVHGTPLVSEQAQAWRLGPVFKTLYSNTKKFGSSPVTSVAAQQPAFTEPQRDIVDSIFNHYSQFTGIQLSAMTHKAGSPWHITWEREGRNSPISNDLIENYYRKMHKAI